MKNNLYLCLLIIIVISSCSKKDFQPNMHPQAEGVSKLKSLDIPANIVSYNVPAKMQWWANARFGMFIHFGTYSLLGRGEWVFNNEGWTKSNYQTQVSANFNPVNFDAHAIVTLAKNAGMKYLVFTAKHHEGFAMWNSNVTSFRNVPYTVEYNLYDFTVFKRDIMMELKNECDAQGIRFCVYYSILDWNHLSQDNGQGAYNGHTIMSSPTARTNYITDMKAQLAELVTKYHPAVMWFDGVFGDADNASDPVNWFNTADGNDLYNYMLSLDPNIIVNERPRPHVGIGDFDCPEQTVPAKPLIRSWETNTTMNGAWGYDASKENSYKNLSYFIREMITVASREGNYMLNIGPKGDGTVTNGSQSILAGFATWMPTYGNSIYGTTRSPFSQEPSWGRFTKKSGVLYAHVFTWPSNGLLQIPQLTNTISRVYLMNNPGTNLTYSISGGNINVTIPATAPNANASVIVVEVNGMPTEAPGIKFYKDGNFAGDSTQILPVGNYTAAQLAQKGLADNSASSLKLKSGYILTMYSGDNFTGNSWTVTDNLSSFFGLSPSANDVVSSCKVTTGVACYPDGYFTGTQVVLPVGTYTTAQLTALGVANNSVSSMKVPAGRSIIIYSGDNFTGTSWTINNDTGSLFGLSPNANDQMSSCKVL